MDNQLAFKLGFLQKMAEAGYTPSTFMKEAGPVLDTLFTGARGVAEGVRAVSPLALAALAAPPAALGYLGGRAAAEASKPEESEVDEENIKTLRDHYRRLALRAQKIREQAAYMEELQGRPRQSLLRPSAL